MSLDVSEVGNYMLQDMFVECKMQLLSTGLAAFSHNARDKKKTDTMRVVLADPSMCK